MASTGDRVVAGATLSAAVMAAAVALFVGVSTVASSERAASQTAFAGAIQNIGGTTFAQRAGGVVLARSIVVRQLADADDPSWLYRLTGQAQPMRDQAAANFRTALRATEVSLTLAAPESPAELAAVPNATCPGGPSASRESVYEADEIKTLLDEGSIYSRVAAQTVNPDKPNLDLSGVNLCGQAWRSLNLGSVGSAYLARIDLRLANLTGAHLNNATFDHAVFTNASLSGADLTCARGLETVDFTGADVSGAIFTGTAVTPAQLHGARGTPKRMPAPGDSPC